MDVQRQGIKLTIDKDEMEIGPGDGLEAVVLSHRGFYSPDASVKTGKERECFRHGIPDNGLQVFKSVTGIPATLNGELESC